jgi:hypothetical protein
MHIEQALNEKSGFLLLEKFLFSFKEYLYKEGLKAILLEEQ